MTLNDELNWNFPGGNWINVDAAAAELNADVLSVVPVGSAPHQTGLAYPSDVQPHPLLNLTQIWPIVLEHIVSKNPPSPPTVVGATWFAVPLNTGI